jgi:hypothetical protein
MKPLNVVYDLRVLPPTFDFPYFMAVADARRRLETHADAIVLWLVTGASRRPRSYDWNPNLESTEIDDLINLRLTRVIFPLASLIENVVAINIINEKFVRELGFPVFHPFNYNFQNPSLGTYHKSWHCLDYASKVDMRILKNSVTGIAEARRYLAHAIGSETPVILTVRNNVHSFDQTRNSRAGLLREAIFVLRDRGFVVGIIPDTSLRGCAEKEFQEILLTTAAFDVQLRSAIYEQATFCLFEPTGPLVLAHLNKNVKFIAYGMAWSETFSADYQLQRGFQRDSNYIAPECPSQLYLWGDLDMEILRDWAESFSRKAI